MPRERRAKSHATRNRRSPAGCRAAYSEALEEGEQAVRGPVPARGGAERGCVRERLLLDPHIGVHVDLRRFWRLVSEPEGNHGRTHPTPEEIHGGRVPESVRGGGLRGERWTGPSCGSDVPGDEPLERAPGTPRRQWASRGLPRGVAGRPSRRIAWRGASPRAGE